VAGVTATGKVVCVDNPLTVLTLDQLRRRHSEKWRRYDPDVLPMWVAEMDVPLAEPIRAALAEAVTLGDVGYCNPGRIAEAHAGFAARRYGWCPDPAYTLLLPDVMTGVGETLRAVTGPGDGVVVNTPVYPPFFETITDVDRRVVESPLDPDLRLDLDRLERDYAAGARAHLLCNPHNPTGVVCTPAELLAVAELARRYDVRLLVDEIHAPLVYPGAAHTPFASLDADAAARAVIFVSASKAWNLPGLKAGLAIGSPESWPDLRRLPRSLWIGAGLFGVIASEVAFTDCDPWLDALVEGLDANRATLGKLLAEQAPGVGYRPPAATYLAWLDCRALGLPGDPAEVFLDRGRLAVNSGPLFGPPGAGYVRLNFATSPELLAEGVRRLVTCL